jgi:hypothetical protein
VREELTSGHGLCVHLQAPIPTPAPERPQAPTHEPPTPEGVPSVADPLSPPTQKLPRHPFSELKLRGPMTASAGDHAAAVAPGPEASILKVEVGWVVTRQGLRGGHA